MKSLWILNEIIEVHVISKASTFLASAPAGRIFALSFPHLYLSLFHTHTVWKKLQRKHFTRRLCLCFCLRTRRFVITFAFISPFLPWNRSTSSPSPCLCLHCQLLSVITCMLACALRPAAVFRFFPQVCLYVMFCSTDTLSIPRFIIVTHAFKREED